MKQRSNGNFFSLPNEIFLLGLRPGELAVYSYLRRCEDRGTHQCWPSYKTIGKAVGMSENTVRKAGRTGTALHRAHRGGDSNRAETKRKSALHPPARSGVDRSTL